MALVYKKPSGIKRPESGRFLESVDWRKLKLPMYPNIIKNPMDLGTISRKINNLQYSDIFEFNEDMVLIWSNAKKFYQPGSNTFKVAGYLSRAWNRTFSSIRNDPAVAMLWGRKSRRSKPKKSPRIREKKEILVCHEG